MTSRSHIALTDTKEERSNDEGGDSLQLASGLYLINQASILISFRRVDSSGRSIDEWHLKETLRKLVSKETSLSAENFELVMMKENHLLPIRGKENLGSKVVDAGGKGAGSKRREREGGGGSGGKTVVACILVRVVCAMAAEAGVKLMAKMNGLDLTLNGSRLVCDAFSGDVDFDDIRRAWESKYGTSGTGYQSKRPGERPDTLVIQGLPRRWLAEPRVSSKPSILVTHSIFSTFGTIRNLEFLDDEDDLATKRSGKGGAASGALTSGLECGVIVQFDNHASLSSALKALCGRAMKKSGSSLCVHYKVNIDGEEYFSEKSMRRRKFERDRVEESERRKAAEEKRREAIEDRKAELMRQEEERKAQEETIRLKQEEVERVRREEEAARIAEEKRKEEEERIKREEEERKLEEERKRREEAAKEEERRKKEEERVEREKKEMEARSLRKERERKEREEEKARRQEEEMRKRELAAKRREEEEKERRRIVAERDLRRLDERRQLLEEELGRRHTEKRLRARVEENMAERAAAAERERRLREQERRELVKRQRARRSSSSSIEEEDDDDDDDEGTEAEKEEEEEEEEGEDRRGRICARVQLGQVEGKLGPIASKPRPLSPSTASSDKSMAGSDKSSASADSSDGISDSGFDDEVPHKRLRSIVVCSPLSDR